MIRLVVRLVRTAIVAAVLAGGASWLLDAPLSLMLGYGLAAWSLWVVVSWGRRILRLVRRMGNRAGGGRRPARSQTRR